MRFNLAAFLALPAVIDMTPLGASRAVVFLDPSYLPPLAWDAPAGAAAGTESGTERTVLTFVVIIGVLLGCSALMLLLLFYRYRTTARKPREVGVFSVGEAQLAIASSHADTVPASSLSLSTESRNHPETRNQSIFPLEQLLLSCRLLVFMRDLARGSSSPLPASLSSAPPPGEDAWM
ncbi:hypothetical protein T484DRAFT_1943728 [Baffinella frigidus]|nr:hypothetical protein T484DRAFT_1943728 [Cryptophyta sp. CCMP2293]